MPSAFIENFWRYDLRCFNIQMILLSFDVLSQVSNLRSGGQTYDSRKNNHTNTLLQRLTGSTVCLKVYFLNNFIPTFSIHFEEDNKVNVERIADLENYKKSTESSITELEKQNKSLDAKLSQKDEAIDSLEKKLKQSEANCLSASRTKDESNIRIEKLKKHNSSIKSNLESKETEISVLNETIKDLDELREKDLEKYKSEIENLKKDLKKKNLELTTANSNSKMVAFACFTIFLVVIVVGDFWFNGESPSSWLSFSKVNRFFKSA